MIMKPPNDSEGESHARQPALRPSMSPPGRRGWISSFRRPTATVQPDHPTLSFTRKEKT